MVSFAIEVPAEANPLTNRNLYHVLRSAASNDQQQVQTGAKQLQNWEKESGFYSSLQSLYIDLSLPIEIRYLAIIQLKNAVDKHWRRAALNSVSKDEKELIRSRSLESVLNEPDTRLALQSSIFLSKIIRFEYPREWPDAVPSIVSSLQSAREAAPNSLRLARLLLVLLHVIKELSRARLRSSQQSLQAVASEITRVLFIVYAGKAEIWLKFLQFGGDDEGGALESMDRSLLALRILRRLIIAGYEHPNREPAICEIWMSLSAQFGRMLGLISSEDQTLELQAVPRFLVEKHLLQIAKLHLNMAKDHAAAFVLLPGSLELARSYWGFARDFSQTYGMQPSTPAEIGTDGDLQDIDEISFTEQLSLKGLLLLRACSKMIFNPAQSFKYPRDEDKKEKNVAKDLMKNELLTAELARDVMETLVTRFFVFTPRDLKQWEEEPDEWEKSQEGAGDDWEFSIRTCSEKLFLDLVINYKAELVPPLISVILDAGRQKVNDVFFKDSIYAAIGLAAPVLEETFDFATFLESTLVQELSIERPDYNILRRRIAIILGQWLPVKEGLNRPLVYGIFQHLLDEGDQLNDEVVRVTAGRQLYNVIDPFEFTAELFAPFAPQILNKLLALIGDVQLPETKLALLQTLSLIVVKMERLIGPFGDQILQLLEPLWDQAKEEYLLKQTILGILTALVISMQSGSQKYHQLILGLIRSSIEPDSESRTYLLEDALDLWAAVLEQTPTPAPTEIIAIVQYLVPMFNVASDTLRKALEITEAYIYLIPSEILSNAPHFLAPFATMLSSLSREANELVTNLVELLVRSADMLSGISAVQQLASTLLSTSFLSTLLEGLRDAYEAHQTTGPNQKYPSIDGIIETNYLSVLARLAVTSPSSFISVLDAARQDPPIDWLLTEWFGHIDNITHPIKKKLSCLALTALLETGKPWILSRLQLLMTMWTDVVTDLLEDYEDGNGGTVQRDCLVYTSHTLAPSETDSPATARSRQLTLADPVHRIDTRDFVREKLGIAVQLCGGMEPFREKWVGNVDADILKSFSDLGIF
ncbi:MAG: hypothetical protein Q9217_005789 [Psora testacea]